MFLRRRFKIGLQSDRMEDIATGKPCLDCFVSRGSSVDMAKALPDRPCKRWIGVAVTKLAFPKQMFFRFKELHGAEHDFFIVGQDVRGRSRKNIPGNLVPRHLKPVPLHRSKPVGLDLKFVERAFDAKDLLFGFDFPDIR